MATRFLDALGCWKIPVPLAPRFIEPEQFLVPLVGFDSANYRLGYGGGYYDRTLAVIDKPVTTIGVGMEQERFDSIDPQPHDIAMDFIVTENGIQSAAE